MNSVGYSLTLRPQLRDDEALVVENAIRLAVDSIVNVLYGVNSARAREYHRVVSERDKEIERLEAKLTETAEELEVLRRLGCSCGGTQRSVGGTPSSGDLRGGEQSGPETGCVDSAGPAEQQHGDISLNLGLYAGPPSHMSSPGMESALPSSHNRIEMDHSGTSHPGTSHSGIPHSFEASVMACSENLPPSTGALILKEEPHDINPILIKWEVSDEGAQEPPESKQSMSAGGKKNVEDGERTQFGENPHVGIQAGRINGSEQLSKTLVPVRYRQQQKYVKLDETDEEFDFHKFHQQVVEKFLLPLDAKITYRDVTGTEVDAEIFSEFINMGNAALTVFLDHDVSQNISAYHANNSESSFSLNVPTVPDEEIPKKRERIGEPVFAKQLVEAVLTANASGLEILFEYQATETLTNASRRQMVNLLVAHMIDNHGYFPSKVTRELYALGIVTLFPSLRDPYTKTGYEHFYDAKSGAGYMSWRLKTVQRKTRRLSVLPPHSPTDASCGDPKGPFYDAKSSAGYMSWRLKSVQRKTRQLCALGDHVPTDASCGGPNLQRTVNIEMQLEGQACQEALTVLGRSTDRSVVLQKMRETFQHRQSLVNDPHRSGDVFSTFPRFLDTKGLVEQDFTLLFDEQTSSMLLQKWDMLFKPNVIREAKRLGFTPELHRLLQSAEVLPGSECDETTGFDAEMSSLLLLLHLLPPPAAGPRSPKISVRDAVERLVVFRKSCCSPEELLQQQPHGRQLHLLAVGQAKNRIESFYVAMGKHLIPCQSNDSLGAFDELFKAHFVFNVSYDAALVNFYTFLQTTVYNIDVGKMKESPRVREIRARLLNQLTAVMLSD